jgi:hypothetical protein
MQPQSFPSPAGRYNALAPLVDQLNTLQDAAAAICAPHGLQASCPITVDATGPTIYVEARNPAGELLFTGMGTDPLVDLQRQLPQPHAAACDQQERTTGFMQRKA